MSDERMDLFREDGSYASLRDVMTWFLYHYEGMEHLTEGGKVSPETWYTVTTILRRCVSQIDAATPPVEVER